MKTINLNELRKNDILEEWRDIEGYKGRYKVSSLGRVKSVDLVLNNRYSTYFHKGRILRLNKLNRYVQVYLSVNDKGKSFSVHRLVANAFIPNPQNLPCINHINEDRLDNSVKNLEWCTQKYNNNYGTRIKRASTSLLGSGAIPVIQMNMKGEVIKIWSSGKEAERKTGISSSGICQCCKGYIKKFKKYKWKYETV